MKPFKAFSLVELLTVVAVLVILISMLQPSLQSVLDNSERLQCSTHQKAMVQGFLVYEEDHGEFPYAGTNSVSWVGSWNKERHITSGTVYPYIGDVSVYLCPSDESVMNHIRSYSVSAMINDHATETRHGIPLFKRPELTPSPSKAMVFIEEDDPRAFNMGAYSPGGWYGWVDNVAGWHDLGNNIAYMDGHVEYMKWVDPQTPSRFLVSQDFRQHEDKIRIMEAYSAGLFKP